MSGHWALMVHGGAKDIPPDRAAANRAGCLAAVRAGQSVLEAGGSAVKAVVAAIQVLEDDSTFNAGTGSVRNGDGGVECDAALMDGRTLELGAVAALRGVRNPILAARAMLRDVPVLLVGEGARRYAVEKGLELCDDEDLAAATAAEACDTVGCVALDRSGAMAAGTSTGGLEGVRPGRVGDSPIPGCGLAAEDGVGAVSLSGDGESILRLTLAARIMHGVPTHGVAAGARAIGLMPRVGGEGGCILLTPQGGPAMAHNSQAFAVAYASARDAARSFLHQDEFEHERR
jgi:beta-aspartyl-peptidase (threonine type)